MRSSLLHSTIIVAVCYGAPAFAQTAPAGHGIEDVVITAQKRKERLQAVAVSASTLRSAVLTQSNISDISDLSKLIPSASIQGTTNGRVPYAMRGVTTTANEANVGLSSGVAILLDGVPIPSDAHTADQIEDVDNIQVLKGPQATLGGRTASAGVISFVTRSPKDHWTGQVGSTFTTDGEERGNFYLAGPLTDQLSFSLTGYGNQVKYPIRNIFDDKRTTVDNQGVRGKLRWQPTADLTVTLSAHYAHDHSYGDNFVYTYLTPGSTLLFPGSPLTEQAELGPLANPKFGNLKTNSAAQNIGAIITDRDATLNIDYQLGTLDVTSTTSVLREQAKFTQDLFVVDNFFFNVLTGGHAPPFDNNQTIRNDVQQVTEELHVASPSSDRLNYVAGLFYSDTKIYSNTQRPLAPAAVDIDVAPNTASYDLYGRLTYKITPQFQVVGGLRYNYDDLKYTYNQISYLPFAPAQSSGHYGAGVGVGDLSAQYFITPNNMAYATYARGYAPPAYNTASPLFSDDSEKPVGRMDINHFEIGSKGTYLDRRLLANISLFQTLYHNYQIETPASLPGLLSEPQILSSAPKAQSRGIELDTTWRATDELTLTFNAALIDATFVRWNNAPCAADYPNGFCNGVSGRNTQNVDGKTLPNSPKFKFTADANYAIPLGAWSLALDGNLAYRTSAQMLADQNPHAVQGDYGILNLNATLQSPGGNYSAMIFVNNVTNKVYYTDVEDFFNSVWANTAGSQAVSSQPARDAHRYGGIRLTAKF